jgi:hypothetical protein
MLGSDDPLLFEKKAFLDDFVGDRELHTFVRGLLGTQAFLQFESSSRSIQSSYDVCFL